MPLPKNPESRKRILAAALALKKLPPERRKAIMDYAAKRRGIILEVPKR